MNKYRKKPVIIEAIQFTGTRSSILELEEFITSSFEWMEEDGKTNEIKIETLEGPHIARIGDYIIKGVKGEFYPCKPDIFEMTYEEVE